MDVQWTPEQQALRDQVRRLCAGFPDDYCHEKDVKHEFPEEFYQAVAAGGCESAPARRSQWVG